MRPFVDLHVLRDNTDELTLYGDDGEAIPDPDPAALLDALDRLALAVARRRARLVP